MSSDKINKQSNSFDSSHSSQLQNKTIVITRAIDQAEESSLLFSQYGAKVILFPAVKIIPPDSWKEFDDVVMNVKPPDYIIFTSSNAVKKFYERLSELNQELNYTDIIIAAVGSKTAAECKRFGIPVNILPDEYSARGLIKTLSHYELKDRVIFIPRSAIGRDELPVELEKTGAVVKAVSVYNVVQPNADEAASYIKELQENKIDLFVFTSPSTFENFISIVAIDDIPDYFRETDVAAIGSTTRAAIEERGVKVSVQPEEFTMEGLLKAVLKFYQSQENN